MQFFTLAASLAAAAAVAVAAPAAPEARANSYLSGSNSGDGTFYATGKYLLLLSFRVISDVFIGLGACGITNSDTDYIVAVSQELFDSYPGYSGANPNKNPVCNKKIKASCMCSLLLTVSSIYSHAIRRRRQERDRHVY